MHAGALKMISYMLASLTAKNRCFVTFFVYGINISLLLNISDDKRGANTLANSEWRPHNFEIGCDDNALAPSLFIIYTTSTVIRVLLDEKRLTAKNEFRGQWGSGPPQPSTPLQWHIQGGWGRPRPLLVQNCQ